jgi:SAM-dependent methyltransferase
MPPVAPPCQYCSTPLTITWLDLGLQPLANAYAPTAEAALHLPRFPLHARVCPNCWLVQVDRVVPPDEIFGDYAYFSSYSDSWLDHCRDYARMATERFHLNSDSLVVEIASNDGYLLKFFKQAGTKVLGIDPAANVAAVAKAAGIETEIQFFSADFATELLGRGLQADHLSAKNVLAHVPDIGDFVAGVSILLKPEAAFTVEFPHLLQTITQAQFDQIYHEHFTYLSLVSLEQILADKGLRVFDVEKLTTHGGSLRVFVCHQAAAHPTSRAVEVIKDEEVRAGLNSADGYSDFAEVVTTIRDDFRGFLADAKAAGHVVAGYGAAAKGNTFLNYVGATPETLAVIADRSAAKAGKFMPGSGIPIVTPETLFASKPDYLVILPWNLRTEIMQQMSGIREWGGRFVTAVPSLKVF